jgi:hypothetical protein
MKRKRALALGLLLVAIIVLAVIVLNPALRAYLAQLRIRIPGPPFTTSSTGPTDGYGVYESCSPKEAATCLSHLDTMAAAGFKLVINYDEMYGDANFQKAYLDHAQSVGMKVIVGLSNPAFYDGTNLREEFPALAQTCNCTDNREFIQYVVNLVKNHPAVWGYYIGDEVDPNDHDKMKSELADVVHQVDPTHPRLFIDNPGHSIAVWHANSPFFDTSDVIGTDFYPIRDDSPHYPTIDQTDEVASNTQAYADVHNEGSAFVLQAFSYSNYNIPGVPYPTADQMKYMLAQTLANSHPRIILWYSYYDTMSSDKPVQHWDDLKAIIAASGAKKE